MKGRFSILFFAAIVGAMAADSPFIGKWKLNPDKSQFAGTTMTIQQLPSGEMQQTAQGQSYKFKVDGKDYPVMPGITASWKQVDPSTWERVTKQGAMTVTSLLKISGDGKTLTVKATGKKPNGGNFEENATMERVSGGPGLAGQWKSTKVQASTENWEISANGDDGLTMKIVDYNAVCSLKFDGKDYPCTGPTLPKNFTLSAKRTNPRTFEMSEKIDGKVVFGDVFTVSADGKTMMDEGAAPGSTEKTKSVYDKQ
jgi:hypothetical protein